MRRLVSSIRSLLLGFLVLWTLSIWFTYVRLDALLIEKNHGLGSVGLGLGRGLGIVTGSQPSSSWSWSWSLSSSTLTTNDNNKINSNSNNNNRHVVICNHSQYFSIISTSNNNDNIDIDIGIDNNELWWMDRQKYPSVEQVVAGQQQQQQQQQQQRAPLEFVESQFFSNDEDKQHRHRHRHRRNIPPETPETKMLAFLRIPKTGSTTLLNWMAMVGDDKRNPQRECYFGPLKDQQSSHPQQQDHNNNNTITNNNRTIATFPNESFNHAAQHCPHWPYEYTVLSWVRDILPLLKPELELEPDPPKKKVVSAAHDTAHDTDHDTDHDHDPVDPAQSSMLFSLQFFTIVRDPFDRLVSFFHYVQRAYPGWSEMMTPRQIAAVRANDLRAWMQLLYLERGSLRFHLPYQKNTLVFGDDSKSNAKAIAMIQGPSPRIFTVLQECFEASLWLLVDTFPTFFSAQATMDLFHNNNNNKNNNTTTTTTNNNNKNNDSNKLNQKDESQVDDPLLLQWLRRHAHIWFEDDFTFYEEAVRQFRLHLASSQVDAKIQQDCIETLDQRRGR